MPLIILLVVLAATFGFCGTNCQKGCLDGIREVRKAVTEPLPTETKEEVRQ